MSKPSTPFNMAFPYAAYLNARQRKVFQEAVLALSIKQELPAMDAATDYAFGIYREKWRAENENNA